MVTKKTEKENLGRETDEFSVVIEGLLFNASQVMCSSNGKRKDLFSFGLVKTGKTSRW